MQCDLWTHASVAETRASLNNARISLRSGLIRLAVILKWRSALRKDTDRKCRREALAAPCDDAMTDSMVHGTHRLAKVEPQASRLICNNEAQGCTGTNWCLRSILRSSSPARRPAAEAAGCADIVGGDHQTMLDGLAHCQRCKHFRLALGELAAVQATCLVASTLGAGLCRHLANRTSGNGKCCQEQGGDAAPAELVGGDRRSEGTFRSGGFHQVF